MKRMWITVLTLLLVLLAAACQQNPAPTGATVAPSLSPSPEASPSASPEASPSPSTSPSASVTPTPVPGGPSDVPGEVINSGKIEELADACDIVVLGTFTEYKGIWNAARDPKDVNKESETNYLGEKQYTFHVLGVYQGSKLVSKGSDIVVTMPYEAKLENWKASELDATFVEPPLNREVMLFLSKDNDFSLFFANTDPYCFTLDADNALHATSYNTSTVAAWDKQYPSGLSLETVRKALGL